MHQQVYLHIPKPCHENWDKMLPAQQGRLCESCALTVTDFSGMSDEQILKVLSKSAGKTCGRFTRSQLERPMEQAKQEISLFLRPHKVLLASLVPALLVAGTTLAQKATQQQHITVSKVDLPVLMGAVAQIIPNPRTLSGRVTGTDGLPISGATIKFQGKPTRILSDTNGEFKLTCKESDDMADLLVTHTGYQPQTIRVKVPQNKAIEIQLKPEELTTGEYVVVKKQQPSQIMTDRAETVFTGKLVNNTVDKLPFAKVSVAVPESAVTTAEPTITLKELAPLKEVIVAGTEIQGDVVTVGGISIVRTVTPVDTARMFVDKLFNNDLFKAFPNPAISGSNVQLKFRKGGDYAVQLFDNAGKLYAATQLRFDKNTLTELFPIPSGLTPGIYYISATSPSSKKRYVDKIIVQ